MNRRIITNRAISYILSRKLEDLRNLKVEEIAKNIGIDKSYLSRCFKMDQRITLSSFILREKIYRAIFILEENCELSIKELAEKLGFLKVEDFINRFKAFIAVEPERYRDLRKSVTG